MGVEVVRAKGIRSLRGRDFASSSPIRLRALTLALTLAALLALTCSSAFAAAGHPFLARLTPPGGLALPGGPPTAISVAVDSTSGNVFVGNDAAGVVDVFSASGASITQFGGGTLDGESATNIRGLAIDAAGRVYVADTESVPGRTAGVVYVYKPDGFGGYSLLSEWRGPTTPFGDLQGVAVDSSTSSSNPAAGNVYIDDGSTGLIDVFKPSPAGPEEAKEGTLISTLKGKPKFEDNAAQNNAVAVSATTGAVYVANSSKQQVEVFNAAGEFERSINGKGTPSKSFGTIEGLAVEEPSEDLYVADEEAVEQLNPAGEPIGRTSVADSTDLLKPLGVAVDNSGSPSHGQLYVLEGTTGAVDVYGPTVPVPSVTTGKPSGVTRAPGTGAVEATLNGTINPEGEPSSYHFEYREQGTATFQSTAPEPVSGSSPTEVHATVKLLAGTSYEFRLVGEDSAHKGTASYGLTVAFKGETPPAVTGVATGAATNVSPTGATLTGSLNPQTIETSYRFEYGETIGYGKSTTPVTTSSKTTISAEQAVAGLESGRTYHFRIVATNEFGTTAGLDATFTTTPAGAPSILGESSESNTPESETLRAEINPGAEASKYHFEYGETESYGQATPEGEVPVGGSVSAEVPGLKPQTTYHFRVVAANGKGETKGSDLTFTTSVLSGATTPALPDGRAYELVSPPDKHGGYIEPLSAGGSLIQASEDGNSLAYVDLGSVVEHPEGNLSPEPEQVISTRGSSSWNSQEIVAPTERVREANGKVAAEYVAFSANLSLGLLQPLPFTYTTLAEPPLTPPLSEAERGHQEKTIYLRANPPLSPASSQTAIYEEALKNGEKLAIEHGESAARPGYLALVTGANTPPGTVFGGVPERRGRLKSPQLAALDATPDLSHVVLSSDVPLAAPPSALGLYEWAAGALQPVSVLPSGQPAPRSLGRVELGSGNGYTQPNSYRHAISDNGSRVIWSQTPPPAESVAGSPKLYLRDMVRGETIQLDKPAAGVNPTAGQVVFQTASADGSKVFFTDTEPLTPDSKASLAGSPQVERPDLYECEIVEEAGKLACKLTDLTAPQSTAEGATVQGVLGASEDGSYVYIVATGVLATGGQPGANNLYALHQEGAAWSTKFIAALSSEDFPDWAPALGFNPKVVETIRQTSRVSPNGRFLAFMSNRRLTGYNNTDVNEEGGPHADEEVFLYDASTAGVSCASCNPSGARPRGVLDTDQAGEGNRLLVDRVGTWTAPRAGELEFRKTDHWLAGSVPGATPIGDFSALHQPRYLSDSGRLFFTSADALVPEAAGRTRPETIVPGSASTAAVGIENVYQYEPNSVGNCSAASGCVALLSSGTSAHESALLDASASGNDVFFITDSKLLPQDTDSSYDVYDARVCSGSSPCLVPPSSPPAPCASNEECRSGGSSQQTFQAPLTATFSGPGNTTHVLPAGGTLPAKASTPPLTRAQKLARALKACHKLAHRTHSQKLKRARCEAHARKLYKAKRGKKK